MIMLLDTSSTVCHLQLVEGEWRYRTEWDAGRSLAKGLLAYIESELEQCDKTFSDVSGIGVFRGPGSFTGLRIGLTVANTLADSLAIPIIGESGDDWQKKAIERLSTSENERIVLPFYGSDAHITQPRK